MDRPADARLRTALLAEEIDDVAVAWIQAGDRESAARLRRAANTLRAVVTEAGRNDTVTE